MNAYTPYILASLLSSCSLIIMADDSTAINNAPLLYLEQNWTDDERDYFYFADQGSRLIPYDFFLHLEQKESTALLRNDSNMLELGFIPTDKSKHNPDSLPIGLARNGDYMGFTCAACHTQQLTYQQHSIRIDGGQAFIDLQGLLSAIKSSLKATIDDKEKFTRFQQKLLGNNASKQQIKTLEQELLSHYQTHYDYSVHNHSTVAYGFSRLDAFGAILNKALLATTVPLNRNEATAPTSFPYLWDTPQHDYVEWNGSQSNSRVGALARNIGEVIGVFGELETETSYWLGFIDGGYQSSIQTGELLKLEKLISKLYSPIWPDIFPKIDAEKAAQGRQLYEQHCIACHLDIERTEPLRKIKVQMSTLAEIQTDPLMAENAVNFRGKTGKFEGRPRYYFTGDLLPSEAPAIHIANNLMIGILKNNPWQAYLAKKDAQALGHPDVNHPPKYVDGQIIEHGQEVSDYALLAYKARPLNGIWSSGPFLHNGSVPNLYQLLLPADQRVKQFNMGSWEFDPVNVGYISTATHNNFIFDTTLKGNSNAGHEYGTGFYGQEALSEQQRWALIEYLKTL